MSSSVRSSSVGGIVRPKARAAAGALRRRLTRTARPHAAAARWAPRCAAPRRCAGSAARPSAWSTASAAWPAVRRAGCGRPPRRPAVQVRPVRDAGQQAALRYEGPRLRTRRQLVRPGESSQCTDLFRVVAVEHKLLVGEPVLTELRRIPGSKLRLPAAARDEVARGASSIQAGAGCRRRRRSGHRRHGRRPRRGLCPGGRRRTVRHR